MRNVLLPAESSLPAVTSAVRSGRGGSQLDLGLVVPPPAPSAPRRPQVRTAVPPAGNRSRAQWWFRQMRQIVAEGRDFDAPGVF